MTETEVHLPVGSQPAVETVIEIASRAEVLGYDRIWIPETWGRDAVAVLAAIADRLERANLGTSILNVYSRSPALLGQTAVTLAELAPGSFRMGIGPSGPAVIERWHGLSYDRPLRRTREAAEIIKAVNTGEVVSYDGEIFSLDGFRLRCDPPAEPIPVDLAGLGPKAVELAGFVGDGWHALFITPSGLSARLDDLRRGAAKADRDPGSIRVTASVTCCALDDGERARQLVAEHIGFYLGSMGPFYARALARQGRDALAEEVVTAWRAGDREGAVERIRADLLDDIAVAGTPETARQRLASFAETDGLDAVAVSFPRGASPEQTMATLDALQPS